MASYIFRRIFLMLFLYSLLFFVPVILAVIFYFKQKNAPAPTREIDEADQPGINAAIDAGDPGLLPSRYREAHTKLVSGTVLPAQSILASGEFEDIEELDAVALFAACDAPVLLRADPAIRQLVGRTYAEAAEKAWANGKTGGKVRHKNNAVCYGNRFTCTVLLAFHARAAANRVEVRLLVNP